MCAVAREVLLMLRLSWRNLSYVLLATICCTAFRIRLYHDGQKIMYLPFQIALYTDNVKVFRDLFTCVMGSNSLIFKQGTVVETDTGSLRKIK